MTLLRSCGATEGKPSSAELDAGITVAQAAKIIGADPSTVRALVDCGQLEGWRVGKHRRKADGSRTAPTGVRVSEGSCWDYRRRYAAASTSPDDAPTAPPGRPRPSRHTALLQQTLASLRAKGVRV